MKKSIKISTVLSLFSLIAIGASAQDKSTMKVTSNGIIYSVGAESGISTGNFKDSYKANLGGSIQADIPIVQQLYATVNAGYTNFFGKSNIDGSGVSAIDIHYLPVMAGLKFFPIPEFYIQADAGAGFVLNKTDLRLDKTAAFLYAPQVGVQVPLSSKSFIDAGIKYEGTTNFNNNPESSKINYFGLRVAYAFSL